MEKQKKKKRWPIIIGFIVFMLLIAALSNSNKDKGDNSTVQQEQSVEDSKGDSDATINGMHFTDKSGRTYAIVVNEDGSAYFEDVKSGEKYYCAWTHLGFIDAMQLSFSSKEPTVAFETGESSRDLLILTDGWIYTDAGAAQAKDPTTRLQVNGM